MQVHRFLRESCLSAIVWATICSAASAQTAAPQAAQHPAATPPPGAPATPPGAHPVTEVATPPVGAAAPSQSQQEIVITGTSIRGVAPVGANLMSVGQAQIQTTPAQSVQQILTSIPAVNGLGVAGQGGFQSNDQSGANIPSIHGLGGSSSTSTLSLIDGHRIPLTGTWHSLGDPNMVPPNAIERVEVLTGGASSIYGSDAVAGVINFITRRSFDGIEGAAQAGFGDHYSTRNANIIAGTKWDTGSVYFAYNYSYRSDLLAADRPFTRANHTAQGGSNLSSFACGPASIQPAGSSLIYGYPYTGAGIANTQANAFCDYSGDADLLPSETRNQGFVKAVQHVGDRLTVEADALFSDRVNKQILSRGSVTATIF